MPNDGSNTDTGMLYTNKKRRPDSNDCEYTGFFGITCPHCNRNFSSWLNAWVKAAKRESKNLSAGQKYFSLSTKPMPVDREGQNPPAGQAEESPTDDIPF